MPLQVEQAEELILSQVKFVNYVLKELKKRNKILNEEMEASKDMSYAKFIGLKTPYEAAICVIRKVKAEFDSYLERVREQMMDAVDIKLKKDKQKRTRTTLQK